VGVKIGADSGIAGSSAMPGTDGWGTVTAVETWVHGVRSTYLEETGKGT
jgi:hypothetical protein